MKLKLRIQDPDGIIEVVNEFVEKAVSGLIDPPPIEHVEREVWSEVQSTFGDLEDFTLEIDTKTGQARILK